MKQDVQKGIEVDISQVVMRAVEEKRIPQFDSGAFSCLVNHFQDMAYAYTLSIVRDPFWAQDVVQESFLCAWKKLERLETAAAFPGWFRQIVRRTALDQLRRQRSVSLDGHVDEGVAAADATPESRAVARESQDEIRSAIARLPERIRTCMMLYYMDGYQLVDIAEFLGIDISAAKKRVQRGREQMKKDLEQRIKERVREFRPGRDTRLVENVNMYTNLAAAAQLGQMSLLEAMLVDGIDVNEPDAAGRTLLHWAVENQHMEAVEMLLKNGADQHLKDHSGRSPRHIAQSSGSATALLKLLNAYR